MIIRRRHTANFTTIGNELFDDSRLQLDEMGLLAYLLSRPHDWEVRRPALRRRFNVGRDGMKRMITNLIRFGWCQTQKTRLANGTFHIIYEIRDEPGPQLSDVEIRAALSLVSSEVGADDTEESCIHENTQPTPDTPQPVAVDRISERRMWPIKNLPNTQNQELSPPNGRRDFTELVEKWPPDKILSRVKAERVFAALTDNQAEAAKRYAADYLRDCEQESRKICDLSTYLSDLRWERLQATSGALAAREERLAGKFFVMEGTRAWKSWDEYLRRTRGRGIGFSYRGEGKYAGKTGRHMDSLLPPSEAVKPPATGDPDPKPASYITEDDEKYLQEVGLR